MNLPVHSITAGTPRPGKSAAMVRTVRRLAATPVVAVVMADPAPPAGRVPTTMADLLDYDEQATAVYGPDLDVDAETIPDPHGRALILLCRSAFHHSARRPR